MNIISSSNAPAAIGPYSQAIESNGFIFCSGQLGINPATKNKTR
jgi:2-iminobutanoate/2-iminopropanoate deaminase